MAIKNRPIITSLLFHSDQGFQHACPEFRNELKLWPVVQSMSRKGNCWDNSVAESFFNTLKTELVYQANYATIKEAERAIFEYAVNYKSKILFPPRYKELDFKTIDKSCKISKDFEKFIHQIDNLMTAEERYYNSSERELNEFCDCLFRSVCL